MCSLRARVLLDFIALLSFCHLSAAGVCALVLMDTLLVVSGTNFVCGI